MTFIIEFNDLTWEKQQEILETIKEELSKVFEQEAKEKGKSLQQLMWEDYDLDYDFNQKEKEKYFETSLDNFLEEQAMNIIRRDFRWLEVNIEI